MKRKISHRLTLLDFAGIGEILQSAERLHSYICSFGERSEKDLLGELGESDGVQDLDSESEEDGIHKGMIEDSERIVDFLRQLRKAAGRENEEV